VSALGLLVVWVLLAAPAPAAHTVSIGSSCGWLNTSELVRLTRLELANASAKAKGLEVGYTCAGQDVSIRMATPAITLQRRVADACCDQAEPERVLALLAVGLYAAAESMLRGGAKPASSNVSVVSAPDGGLAPTASVTSTPSALPPSLPTSTSVALQPPKAHKMPVRPEQPPVAQPSPTALPTATPAPTHPVTPPDVGRVSPAAPPPAQRVATVHEVAVVARARLHNIADSVSLFGAALDYRHWLWPTIHFGGFLDASFGSADRQGGAIDVRLVQLGATAGWRILETGPLSLTSELRGGGSLLSMSGQPSDVDFRADDVLGLTGHLSLALVPMLQSGRIQLGLPLEAGVLFRAPRALVDQQQTVRLDGFWLGLGVAVAVGWGAQPAAVSPRVATERRWSP